MTETRVQTIEKGEWLQLEEHFIQHFLLQKPEGNPFEIMWNSLSEMGLHPPLLPLPNVLLAQQDLSNGK